MSSLKDAKAGSVCRITWMIGQYAEYLKDVYKMKEDAFLQVIQRSQYDVLVKYEGRSIAMSSDVAGQIKVVAI